MAAPILPRVIPPGKRPSSNFLLSNEEYIARARIKHGEFYDYSLLVYRGQKNKVTIVCPEHGAFEKWPSSHLQGGGCPTCYKARAGKWMIGRPNPRKLSTEEFIRRCRDIHGDRYDYSQSEYNGHDNRVTIICREHGPFDQFATHHLKGSNCPSCTGHANYGLAGFIERARVQHGEKYDYFHAEYTRDDTKVEIVCRRCGESFWQKPNSHLAGSGCPLCKKSKGENVIKEFLDRHSIEFETQKTWRTCRDVSRLRFDFYLPIINACIEFQGKQHFYRWGKWHDEKGFEDLKRRDQIKRDWCKANNVSLIEIDYTVKDIHAVLIEVLCQCGLELLYS